MRLSGLSQATFFYENVLNAQKRKSNQNQQVKQKQAKKKKNEDNKFLKLLRGGKLFILGFFQKFEIVMITSFTILLKYILLNHSIESLFVRICFYL